MNIDIQRPRNDNVYRDLGADYNRKKNGDSYEKYKTRLRNGAVGFIRVFDGLMMRYIYCTDQ